MDFFETCSDEGKKSVVLTEKLTCEICGKIKSCYNVPSARRKSSQSDLASENSKEEDFVNEVCQCEEETIYQWLKRLVGFGPRRADKGGDSKGWYSHYAEGLKRRLVGKKADRSSKTSKPQVEEVEVEPEPVLASATASLASPQSDQLDGNLIDAEGKADADDHHSQTSRDSRSRRRRRKKGAVPSTFRDSYSSETRVSQTAVQQVRRIDTGAAHSTATVFQNYRSRVHYTFQLEKHKSASEKKFPAEAATTSEKRLQKLATPKNKQQSAAIDEDVASTSEDLTRNSCSVEPERLELGSNCSACNPVRQKVELKGAASTKHFQNSPASPAIHRSYSNPETDKEYSQAFSQFPATKTFCFGNSARKRQGLPKPPPCKRLLSSCCSAKVSAPRCRSLSADRIRNKSASLAPPCFPNSYHLVLPCTAPSLWISSCSRRKFSPSSGIRQKPDSCPFISLSSKRPGAELTPGTLHSKQGASKPASGRGRAGCMRWVTCSDTRPLSVSRPQTKSNHRDYKPFRGGLSTVPYKMGFEERKAVDLKKRSSQKPMEQGEEILARLQRDKEKLMKLFDLYGYEKTPSLSCPQISRFTKTQSCENNGGDYVENFSTTAPRGLHFSVPSPCRRAACHLNFSQSSSCNRSPDETLCSQCQNVIELNEAACDKECKCEFVLAPHCIRRTGPRSTVSEYLSTIEPPKPRPRVKAVGSEQASAEQDGEKPASSSPQPQSPTATTTSNTKGTGKSSKRRKKKDSVAPAGENPEASAPGDSSGNSVSQPQQSVAPAKNDSGKRDGNNNYGMDISPAKSRPYNLAGYPNSSTPSRLSSAPAHNYVSHLDTGYARPNVSPYFTSHGMRATYVGPSYFQKNAGYFRAAQDFRRSIRNFYDQKQVVSGRAAGDDENLDALRLGKSKSPMPNSGSEKQSAKAVPQKRKASMKSKKKSSVEKCKNLRTQAKSTSSKEETAAVQSRQQSPRLKVQMLPYFPRKSFVEGENPIDYGGQDDGEAEQTLDKNASKSELAAEKSAEITSQTATAIKHGDRISAEKQEEVKPMHCLVEEEVVEEEPACYSEKGETNCVSVKDEGIQKDIDREGITKQLLNNQVSLILDGRESSVDMEPGESSGTAKKPKPLSTVRKIEPHGTFSKALEREANAAGTASVKLTGSNFPSGLFSSSPVDLAGADTHKETPQNAPVPVFQNLMERFSESVHIFVRTKDNNKDAAFAEDKTLQGKAGNAGEKPATLAQNAVEVAEENTGYYPATGVRETAAVAEDDSVTWWGNENMSRYTTAPSHEASSDCMSCSDTANAPEACEVNANATCSATATPVLSVSSVRAVGGDPSPHGNAALEKRDYEMKMEICTTTQHVYLGQSTGGVAAEKSARDIMASMNQTVFSSNRVMKDIIGSRDTSVDPGWLTAKAGNAAYMLAAPPQVYASDGEVGQGENLSTRKPSAVNPRTAGSSVDPIPGGSGTGATKSIVDTIKSSHSMFHQVVDGCDGAMIMTAKSRFLRRIKGESVTGSHPSKSYAMSLGLPDTAAASPRPFSPTECRSLDSAAAAGPGQSRPLRISSLTDVMKKFISVHGTPV